MFGIKLLISDIRYHIIRVDCFNTPVEEKREPGTCMQWWIYSGDQCIMIAHIFIYLYIYF